MTPEAALLRALRRFYPHLLVLPPPATSVAPIAGLTRLAVVRDLEALSGRVIDDVGIIAAETVGDILAAIAPAFPTIFRRQATTGTAEDPDDG